MATEITVADWRREEPRRLWDPSRRLLRAIRRYQSARARQGLTKHLACKYWVLLHRFWSVVTQAEIDLDCDIGGGLLIPHPNGIVIHPASCIGVNCLILQQVTLGTVASRSGVPVIGNHVDIGAGAKILGPVTVGDHVVIGANAVVLVNVSSHTIVAGVPARLIGCTVENHTAN